MTNEIECQTIHMPDGRNLYLFGAWKGQPQWPHLTEPSAQNTSHSRWHPLRQEWVVYAAARQNRTYKPSAATCPICPNMPEGELPLDDFTIAVFENRFPSLRVGNTIAPDLAAFNLKTQPSKGACEVVVYASEHQGSLATIPTANREMLVRVWGQRRRKLIEEGGLSHVMPFENRGEEAGTTLHHPHGQIYAYGELPPVVSRMADAFAGGYSLHKSLPAWKAQTVFETDTSVAFVPPFTRFPYEIWLTTKAFHPTTEDLTSAETTDIANLLRRTILLYDAYFKRSTPYMMIVYMAPKGHEGTFPFHIQFYPLLRSTDRMKYVAGCENGSGMFLVDVLPEKAAEDLRQVGETIL